MHKLDVNARDAILILSLYGSPNSNELKQLFCDIEAARGQFANGYSIWVKLPDNLRGAKLGEAEKIDLMVYSGKVCGLKKVVIEASPKCEATQKIVALLDSIYKGLGIPIDVAYDKTDALRFLGLLWRKI